MLCLEWIRDGDCTVSQLQHRGRCVLGRAQVCAGVAELLEEVAVEGCFPDGTKLVTMHKPIAREKGSWRMAMYGGGGMELQKPTRPQDWSEEGSEAQIDGQSQPASVVAQPETIASAETMVAASAVPASSPVASSSSQPATESPAASSESALLSALLPGEVLSNAAFGDVQLNAGKQIKKLTLTNLDDRPIQVGSHYPLVELNASMQLDRAAAYGFRLNIGAGTAVRFEPGVSRTIEAVEIGGQGVIKGGNNLAAVVAAGKIDRSRAKEVSAEAVRRGFAHKDSGEDVTVPSPLLSMKFLTRQVYASMYGPTTGDRLRVGDTNLILEIEWDACALFSSGVGGGGCYGDELKFGGGKVLRDGMGQMSGACESDALDLCISNVIILDVSGVYKADVGVKNGRIVGIGKAGNPHTMAINPPNMIFGVNTDSIDASGMILTAGAIDSHVHFICPQLLDEALASGVTTLIGGGVGPTSGTNATTCTPNSHAVRTMLEATDAYPINVGLTGKGNSSSPEGLFEQLRAGCIGLKLHEDWGTTPATIDACLRVAESHDIQVTIHTDTLNEGGSCPQTLEAIAGRTIHFYHVEGAGGGHAPDILTACSAANVIPSSTNPTRPYTRNTVDEHVDMLMVCHHLDPRLPEDVCFAESRIRAETIAAEDLLHDMGAISIISSDSQAMGRAGEVITRTWQTAHKMKAQRGQLPADHTEVRSNSKKQEQQQEAGGSTVPAAASAAPSPSASSSSASALTSPASSATPSVWQTPHDNFRLRRYIAKYTCNPARAHGISHVVGSVSVGLLADLVLWQPALFGRAPEMILKGGVIVRAQMGDASASIPTPQPRLSRPMFGAMGQAPARNSVVFVSQAAIATNSVGQYRICKQVEAVKGCRTVQKKDMLLNSATPAITVDPNTYRVTADGIHLTCEPAYELPLTNGLVGLF